MYKELIEKLRCCVEQIRCGDCRYVKDCDGDRMLMSEADDAIEELLKKKDCQYWFEEGGFCSMLGKRVAEPPKEET